MVYMCHIFFILSIIDGHLAWFQVFATVNSAAVDISVHVSLYRLNDLLKCVWAMSASEKVGQTYLSLFLLLDATKDPGHKIQNKCKTLKGGEEGRLARDFGIWGKIRRRVPRKCQSRFLYPVKISFRNEGEIQPSSDKGKREFATNRPTLKKWTEGLGMVAHTYNLSTLRGQGRQITWGQEFETSLAKMVKPHLYYKYFKNWLGVVLNTCNPSYMGGWGRRIAWTHEVEVAVSWDSAIALQPGQQEWNSISNKKKIHCLLHPHLTDFDCLTCVSICGLQIIWT